MVRKPIGSTVCCLPMPIRLTVFWQNTNRTLFDANENLESELNILLDQLSEPSVRNIIFAVANALIGGQPITNIFRRRRW